MRYFSPEYGNVDTYDRRIGELTPLASGGVSKNRCRQIVNSGAGAAVAALIARSNNTTGMSLDIGHGPAV